MYPGLIQSVLPVLLFGKLEISKCRFKGHVSTCVYTDAVLSNENLR
jgi:hypothetical protein